MTDPRSPALTPETLARLRALEQAATPGTWQWVVNLTSKSIHLETVTRGFEIVIDFARWGTGGARPRFRLNGIMEDAERFAVTVPGREHHRSWYQTLRHPDAELIVELRNAAPALLSAAERWMEAQRHLRGAHQREYGHVDSDHYRTCKVCALLREPEEPTVGAPEALNNPQ